MNANIEKRSNTTMLKAPLTNNEQEVLKRSIIGWGKLAAAVRFTGRDANTIKRAAWGFDVYPDTATDLRKFLKSISQ